jgi:two-component system chemotaxis response regulator CheY
MARVLIVDDSAFARHRLQQIFEEGGHEVVGSTGQAGSALSLYQAMTPDLVTMDHVMEEKPGETVLHEILQFDPAARVIMISGSNDTTLEQRVLEAGAKAFVEKFNTNMDLLEIINRVMTS